MQTTLEIPDQLARRIGPIKAQVPKILAAAMQDQARSPDPWFAEVVDILKHLMSFPTPKQIMAIRPSRGLQKRISELLTKNKSEGLTDKEQREMDRYLYLEEVVQLAKAQSISPGRKIVE